MSKYSVFDKKILTPENFYRKVNLDISELVDEDEALELGLDKAIYGDSEGYIYIEEIFNEDKKERGGPDEGYLVKFLTMEDLVDKLVIQNLDTKKVKVKFEKLNLIKNRRLELEDMSEAYIRLGFEDVIKELVEQYNSEGKKGIKLKPSYLDKYNLSQTLEEKVKYAMDNKDYTYSLYNDEHLSKFKDFFKTATLKEKEVLNKILEKRKTNLQGLYYMTFDYDIEDLKKNFDFASVDKKQLEKLGDALK